MSGATEQNSAKSTGPDCKIKVKWGTHEDNYSGRDPTVSPQSPSIQVAPKYASLPKKKGAQSIKRVKHSAGCRQVRRMLEKAPSQIPAPVRRLADGKLETRRNMDAPPTQSRHALPTSISGSVLRGSRNFRTLSLKCILREPEVTPRQGRALQRSLHQIDLECRVTQIR